MSPLSVSVVIPTLNEERRIRRAILSCFAEGATEVIVADGGSRDGTVGVATDLDAIHVPVKMPQRARQMNAGARVATGDLVVFLHADTVFEAGALRALASTARNPKVVGGGFRRRFMARSAMLAGASRLGNLRARYIDIYYGDQAIWVRRETFLKLGCFPEIPRFEDLEICRSLRRVGKLCLVKPGVRTSARRFRGGIASRLLKDFWLTVGYMTRARNQ